MYRQRIVDPSYYVDLKMPVVKERRNKSHHEFAAQAIKDSGFIGMVAGMLPGVGSLAGPALQEAGFKDGGRVGLRQGGVLHQTLIPVSMNGKLTTIPIKGGLFTTMPIPNQYQYK